MLRINSESRKRQAVLGSYICKAGYLIMKALIQSAPSDESNTSSEPTAVPLPATPPYQCPRYTVSDKPGASDRVQVIACSCLANRADLVRCPYHSQVYCLACTSTTSQNSVTLKMESHLPGLMLLVHHTRPTHSSYSSVKQLNKGLLCPQPTLPCGESSERSSAGPYTC